MSTVIIASAVVFLLLTLILVVALLYAKSKLVPSGNVTIMDSMRDANTREDCKRRAYTFFTPAVARHAPFWPASVVLLLALGCGGVVTASAAASRSRRGPPQPHDGK